MEETQFRKPPVWGRGHRPAGRDPSLVRRVPGAKTHLPGPWRRVPLEVLTTRG